MPLSLGVSVDFLTPNFDKGLAMQVLPLSLVFLMATFGFSQCEPLNVTFPEQAPNGTTNAVADNFLGISFELSSFDTLWGSTVDTIPDAMVNYLHNINVRTSAPLRIRVGGNGMDGSTYVGSSMTKMLELTDPDAYFNDIPVNFSRVLFDIMNAMYDEVEPMQFIIGLSMRDPANDQNVLELAKDARELLGNKLDAMLLGNEPDLYAGHGTRTDYNLTTYIAELGHVIGDMEQQGIINDTVLGGPTICCAQWSLSDVIQGGLDQYPYKYYTVQHYPNHACQGPNEGNTNITYYLSHMEVGPYLDWNSDGITLAKEDGIPVLLTEYNTVSCGGTNISSTFAAALWLIDAGLKSAERGFSGAYIHTREAGIQYNLFDPPTSTSSGWITGAPYYAALFLAETFSASGNIIVDLNLNDSLHNPSATSAAYGVYDAESTRGKIVLLNLSEQGDEQTYDIPANMTASLRYRLLLAPSVVETSNISWAGQTVGGLGQLDGEQDTFHLDCTDGCTVNIPGPGAALVILGEPSDGDSFYYGNSTVKGLQSINGSAERRLKGGILYCSATRPIATRSESVVHCQPVGMALASSSSSDPGSVKARLTCIEAEITLLAQKLATLTTERDELRRFEVNEVIELPADQADTYSTTICSLPTELLQDIFSHCLRKHPVMDAAEAPLLLGRVCRAWRTISLQTPKLWSSLHLVIPRSIPYPDSQPELYEQMRAGFEYWLEHLGSLPLNLSLHSEERREDESEMLYSQLEWVFEKSRARWKHLTVYIPSFSLGVFFDLPADQQYDLLESIELGTSNYHTPFQFEYIEFPFLSAATTPNLRKISFHLFSPDLRRGSFPQVLPNITNLTLQRCEHWDMNTPEMLMILGTCTNLVHCYITTTERFHPTAQEPAIFVPAHLAHLKSLRVEACGFRGPPGAAPSFLNLPDIFTYVVAPALEALDVDGLHHEVTANDAALIALRGFVTNCSHTLRKLKLRSYLSINSTDVLISCLDLLPSLMELKIKDFDYPWTEAHRPRSPAVTDSLLEALTSGGLCPSLELFKLDDNFGFEEKTLEQFLLTRLKEPREGCVPLKFCKISTYRNFGPEIRGLEGVKVNKRLMFANQKRSGRPWFD
ncbi:putative glycoside hydrolase [Desarmillaria tabescens]|uniref:Glycoside hydrolase n=1 Tax=Armillaria tabescens TaxID=1929756 RepID=A0AA39NRS9_ARMTA|nr:putative glycoside hydrolase [Desarmillaria tabescens]KAK0470434.1 putative glycoside hydrolase [Desarmillaria tabescens]